MKFRLTRWFLFSLLAVSLATLAVRAAEAGAKEHWSWLSESDKARLLNSIPPAPLPGSDLDKQDLQDVLHVQATRSKDEIAEAMDDEKFRMDIVARVLGPSFTPQNDPATFELAKRALEDDGLLVSTLKDKYGRKRPYQAHPEVHELFEASHASYPSGHSSGSHILAEVLGDVFPAKESELMARADAVAHSRVVAGVHYKSDIEEGAVLAKALHEALLANPEYQKSLAAAKAEVAAQGR
jgi:acid phosphatase (class A)